MNDRRTCGGQQALEGAGAYETVKIEKTKNVCPMCEDYARNQASKPVVVMCCEGACLRGEIARQAANILCHRLAARKNGPPLPGRRLHEGHWTEGFGKERRKSGRRGRLLSRMRKQDDEGRDFRFGAGSDRRGRALRVRSQPVRD